MSEIITPGAARSFYRMGARDYQQDARFPDMDLAPQGFRSFIVCDGVGGEEDGEVASSTVCQAFGEFMAGYANPAYEFTQTSFREAISFAYQRLLRAIGDSGSTMATTLTFLHLNSHNAMVAHIGDSRVYHIRPKVGIMYRTSDHSLVNMLVHAGTITPEQAINHPKSNVITRCMNYVEPGAEPSAADVIVINDIEQGDYFLLCTDGVLHDIDDDFIVELFSSDLTEDEILERLANICENSSDNNTAMLVRIEAAPRVGSAIGEFAANEEIERVIPNIPTDPEIMQIAPANELPLHKRIANRLRNLFSR